MLSTVVATLCVVGQERKPSVHGDLRLIEGFESKILGNKRTLRILLPEGYDKDSRARYAVFYMHDGQNLFDGMTSFIPNKEWRVDETTYALAKSKLVEPLIVVGIDNAGAARGDEYLPTQDTLNNTKLGGQADGFTRFVVEEVMPYVNKTFRTKTGPTDTGVGGSSFGGVISLHMALTRSDVFGKAAVFSPSLWWDNKVMIQRVKDLAQRRKFKVWLDAGTREGDTDGLVTQLSGVMETKGWGLGRDLACFIDEGAEHNEDAWARRLLSALTFLFPAKAARS